MKTASVSLPKLLRARYPSVDSERAALETWAFSQTHLYHARELGRLAAIGIPKEPVWTYVVSPLLFASLFWLGRLPYTYPWFDVFVVPVVIGWVLGGRTVPKLSRYLIHPRARRAALWLGWLGDKEALPHLLRTWRFRPRSAKQKAWTAEVEDALTALLDALPLGVEVEKDRAGLENLLRCCLRGSVTASAGNFTASRTYLLVAILRFLYYDAKRGTPLPLLNRIIARHADSVQTPNRHLIREAALLYHRRITGTLPAAAPLTLRLPLVAVLLAFVGQRP